MLTVALGATVGINVAGEVDGIITVGASAVTAGVAVVLVIPIDTGVGAGAPGALHATNSARISSGIIRFIDKDSLQGR